ncbi:hypothetical protein DICVIV_06441 [Dictyocaulus viviparus]|uniref:C-type lectin domain-containing protein n=1 Tax=Dictyocaulus viviparus TaxID=29172 RepID=A0A0D8XUL5_DICVI|nr:hypothetical protein DICVIV_06441 [Dictyocaulus viviparus]
MLWDLIKESASSDFAWIGMKTQSTSSSTHNSFSNFDKESPIDGCAVIDHNGVWSIRPCEQLRPFVCQMVVDKICPEKKSSILVDQMLNNTNQFGYVDIKRDDIIDFFENYQ